MSAAWATVIAVGGLTIAIKAAGPMLAAGRGLPRSFDRVADLLAPALLAALVVTQTLGDGKSLVLDERAAGLGAAAVAIALKAPVLGAVVAAAVTAGVLRAL